MELFHYLHYGLSAILIFVGVKMIVAHVYEVPTVLALAFIALTMVISIVASMMYPRSAPSED